MECWGTLYHSLDEITLTSLAKVAELKAKTVEMTTKRLRNKKWRVVVGASPPDGSLVKPRPSKIAHRYVKGQACWQPSPIGSMLVNHAIPG